MRRLAVLLSLLFSATAGANVLVTVHIESPPMMGRYRPRTAEVEQAIAAELARLLPRYFRHWNFAPAASATPADYALQFRVQKQGGDQVFTLVVHAKNEIAGTWDEVWMPAGELAARGFPDRPVAGARVAAEIARVLLSRNQSDIAARVKARVPVAEATAAQWQRVGRRPVPWLVLPMRLPDAQALVHSFYLVKCAWPGRGMAELRTRAVVHQPPVVYNDATSRSRYPALALEPLARTINETRKQVTPQIARELHDLKPLVVYLDADDPVGLHMPGAQP